MRSRLEGVFRIGGLSMIYAVASGLVLDVFLTRWGGLLGDEYPSVLRFEVARPYAYRVLSPVIVNAVSACVPDRLAAALLGACLPRSRGGGSALAFAMAQHHWRGEPSLQILVGIWLMFAALWGTLWAWRALAAWALPGRPLLASLAPAVGILALPATFVGGGFLYDFPDLFLVSVAMWAFVRQKWPVWYAILPCVVLNKEASVLVVGWWLAANESVPRERRWTHLAASLALGGGLIGVLVWAFRAAPGSAVQTNVQSNIPYWLSFRWLLSSDDLLGLGIPMPVATHVLILVLVVAAWANGRRRVPNLVERMLLVSVLAVAPLLVLFGFENQVRVFAMAFPSLFLLGVGAADSLAEGQPRSS